MGEAKPCRTLAHAPPPLAAKASTEQERRHPVTGTAGNHGVEEHAVESMVLHGKDGSMGWRGPALLVHQASDARPFFWRRNKTRCTLTAPCSSGSSLPCSQCRLFVGGLPWWDRRSLRRQADPSAAPCCIDESPAPGC